MTTNIQELPKAYNPADVEEKWYVNWLKHNIFHSEIDKNKKPYTIVIPPPNITGSLTMGHILNNTIQDIFIRTKRMQGFNACWVPGTDHASIATESKVVKMLKDNKINKYEIGREEFLKHCWEWKEKYGGIIIQQLKKLGVSCDWQRERFTMDDHYYKKVIEAFVHLYNDGKIYRGFRMVNWDPANKSAISDEEVIYKTVNGKLWYFKYPVKDSSEFITVATTRPETMLGDTGVAVNPNDERFKKFIGKKVVLPIVGREIPVFSDEYVDMEFGTGAVKVTPAHDVNDYDMGQRHKLEIVNILNDDASLNENVPKEFVGLDRFEARKKVVARFEELELLAKVENYQNKVGYSERGNVPIEPYLSEQWFMSMSAEGGSASGGAGLAEPALQVVKDGKVNYHPDHWVKTYEHWMTNIKDWCISRQLWWGHRIPVWYCVGDDHCKLECKEPIVSMDPLEKCPHCGSKNLKQDEDVLDTWASSWLWAHDVFVNDEEQNYYYPTDLLVTAPDIIFFWVARMIMAGMYFKKDIPFKDVYFTSVIRDVQGRKMSKSLGNSPDPLDVICDYGADALRFTVIYLAPLGQDVLFSTDKCELGRNFSNKIWNAGRFLLMNAQTVPLNEKLIDKHIDFSDRWINSRFHETLSALNKAMDKFEVNNASKIIYTYVWNDFCDWYIELAKNRLYSDSEEVKSVVLTRAIKMFENLLKIVHPFMPFITEELWQRIYERKEGESISTSEYPKFDEMLVNTEAEKEMEFVQDIITAIRNVRGEMNIPPSKFVKAFIKSTSVKDYQLDYIKKLAKVEEVQVSEAITKPKASASTIIKNCEIYVPLEGLIDLDVEKNRLQKEISRLEGLLVGIDKKLSNEKFVSNAVPEVVEKERMKKKDVEANLLKVREIFNNLK
ncbi:MAG: valine--tRNA ligase [Ignavibacteria bacterium RIFOXYB2_FULL_35_12]|nr:MAG: valine--tRNA ligase [Ignavibacteria bacterium GWA2_36_19]OGU57836.1 MAG: valine--tRNA ligase [Ignavibacteria bacterium GWF2_35_20]OGU88059.1 MAG: valine--tRNA ligase [Ignavibacteria bacterium RIFOXYA12_FULL_35_25]OGU93086.1 MAG: valine--tRNA ligase [Ignavibacteria bacterium RIFOXYB12_FULL_35_14]OGU98245.1 MAG: valine--tRNA ligase [Ignavibacteria bacterium RIFOXYC2_FULL_35_16]OGV03399.1 MAG: valine--tRNA ligase [Ignavibacteria bacterium RIFOXYB2_FULL_35_12]OGV31133.1 MAG: valine--tRNA 